LSDSTIGIKVADGSYYPVIDVDFRGTKKLVLTTAKDNQEKVQVDLYRGAGEALSGATYIDSLVIENIPPAAQGEPEIELLIGIDDSGQLMAEAFDESTGERQRFDTSISSLPQQAYEEAEFALEEPSTEGETPPEELALEEPQGGDFDEAPLTGEDYPVGEKDRREETVHRRGPNILLLVLFVVLGIALVGAIAYFVYRAISGPAVPPLPATGTTAPAAATPAQPQAAAQPAPAAQPQAAPAAPAAPAPTPAAPPAKSVVYGIKKGDTLWDISSAYYRNPWLYPKIAKANSIQNPDLICAGTRIVIPEN
jgi:LysM repeat protein